MPVSVTANAICPFGARRIVSSTCPSSVNLNGIRQQVLENLFEPLPVGLDRRRAFRPDLDLRIRAPSAPRSAGRAAEVRRPAASSATGSGLISMCPASIFDRSRMSLMRVRRSLPEDWMVCAYLTCSSVRLPLRDCPREAWPGSASEFSGVRSSCDMLARKSDL